MDDKPATISALAEDLLTTSAFWADERCPFSGHLVAGDTQALFVAGDNASGKSLFVEYLRGWARQRHDQMQMCVSIRERTGAGLSEGAGMRRAMMFGSEDSQSTGATSLSTTLRAFSTLKGWADEAPNKRILAVLDEPELGLSHAYAPAMGALLARELTALDRPQVQLVVVTHHQRLAESFALARGEDPTFVHMGSPMSFKDWLADRREHSLESLLELDKVGMEGRRKVWKLEADLKKELQDEPAGSDTDANRNKTPKPR